jgi:hypothetical protein
LAWLTISSNSRVELGFLAGEIALVRDGEKLVKVRRALHDVEVPGDVIFPRADAAPGHPQAVPSLDFEGLWRVDVDERQRRARLTVDLAHVRQVLTD